ncbi:DUF2802 domain-containing protein [Vibrio sp. DW001]|uniref:DUF2802 domain-containing protein n=1 Tax=unclassified Vibrio TaxID=2614977 RepID=UPI0023B0433E|nr:DUF2802 domain-containing protein [Vibrio sp. DW001]
MIEQLDSMTLYVLIGGSLFLALVLGVILLRNGKQTRGSLEHHRQAARNLEKEITKANNQLLEVRSVVIGLGQKVSEQQELIQHLSERITELEHVDSDSRLYSRASKMVQLGAGVDELIEECELPKAEAELMMALQNKISGKEKVPPMRPSNKK